MSSGETIRSSSSYGRKQGVPHLLTGVSVIPTHLRHLQDVRPPLMKDIGSAGLGLVLIERARGSGAR